MTFQQWYAKVSQLIWKIAGCSPEDLVDYCYQDAFSDGATPLQAARAAIRNQEE